MSLAARSFPQRLLVRFLRVPPKTDPILTSTVLLTVCMQPDPDLESNAHLTLLRMFPGLYSVDHYPSVDSGRRLFAFVPRLIGLPRYAASSPSGSPHTPYTIAYD